MSDDEDFQLEMPFINVKSKGGPFDDDAYVCGFEVGAIAAEMQLASSLRTSSMVVAFPSSRYVHAINVPQLDLIAMRYGFTVTSSPPEDDSEWAFIQFSLATTDMEGTE